VCYTVGTGKYKNKPHKKEENMMSNNNSSQLVANVPGLDDLRQALAASTKEFQRYQDDLWSFHQDDNGNFIPPAPVDESFGKHAQALMTKYPRAQAYLRAERLTDRSLPEERNMGERAIQLLTDGAPLEEVLSVIAEADGK
jgi:hypothetical protein